MTATPASRDDCAALDAADPLAHLRAAFSLPEGVIYLDGNSLGAMPAAAPEKITEVVAQQWGQGLIRSWNTAGWVELPQRLGGKIARLIGAPEHCVRACDSTSVNLYKVLHAALANALPGRTGIVTQAGSFPSDGYVVQGLAASLKERGYVVQAVEDEALEDAIDSSTAVVLLNHVDYRNGRLYDMPRLTALAQACGALVVWDLAHSAGALPVALADCKVDYAVGCGYKYLNGGPGAPAFLYVAEKHLAASAAGNPIQGWFGHARPFAFVPGYEGAANADQFLVGTPPVLSMAALELGLDITLQTSMEALRAKSLALTGLFMALAERDLATFGFSLATAAELPRGSQVSLVHERAWPITQALIARGVIGDFRQPNILRFGFAPLYNRYVDVWDAIAQLRLVMQQDEWQAPQFQALNAVT